MMYELYAGASIPPEAMTHFPPEFQIFPPVFEIFFDSVENFQSFTFSRQNFRFSSAKISDDLFFSHRPKISNFPPILALLVHFPPDSRKLLFPPYFSKFPPLFSK